eukprot:842595-Prorocentrum_minimum.AAC.1
MPPPPDRPENPARPSESGQSNGLPPMTDEKTIAGVRAAAGRAQARPASGTVRPVAQCSQWRTAATAPTQKCRSLRLLLAKPRASPAVDVLPPLASTAPGSHPRSGRDRAGAVLLHHTLDPLPGRGNSPTNAGDSPVRQ